MRAVDLRAGLAVLCAVLIASACSTSPLEPPPVPGTVLEIQYVNFAWVGTYKGVVIDSTGAVHSYDLGGKDWNPSDPERPELAELAAKYERARQLVKTLTPAERATLFSLAAQVDDQDTTEPVTQCADAGVLSYSVYVPAVGGRARRILLRSEGDLIRENKSAAARELAKKLADHRFFTPLEGCQPVN